MRIHRGTAGQTVCAGTWTAMTPHLVTGVRTARDIARREGARRAEVSAAAVVTSVFDRYDQDTICITTRIGRIRSAMLKHHDVAGQFVGARFWAPLAGSRVARMGTAPAISGWKVCRAGVAPGYAATNTAAGVGRPVTGIVRRAEGRSASARADASAS